MRPLVILALGLFGATNDAPVPIATGTAPAGTSTGLKEISPGVFDYHGVKLDKENHRISFPGTVNQREGLIEYVLVNEKGKVHESLLATKLSPHDIHLALLLIGLKDPAVNANAPLPPSAIDLAYLQAAPKVKGSPVRITVAWTQDGRRKEAPVENWVLNLELNKTMTPGPWTYNGSVIENGVFLADEELSIVAVITDPTALVNNPRKGYDNDQIWQVKDEVPPVGTPVEIGITLDSQ